MKGKERIILRADANDHIATGHVFRLLALAEILKPTHEVLFCTQTTNQQILHTIATQVDQLIILQEQFEYCLPNNKELNAEIPFDLQHIIQEHDIVVTDGYWFREKYQLSIKKLGVKLVMIDDLANQFFYANAVINHAPGVKEENYSYDSNTKLYLGLDYALLRESFYKLSKQTKKIDEINKVFICFGGGTYDCIIENIIRSLQLINTIKEIHLLSPSDKQFKDSNNVYYYSNLSSEEVSDLMWKCHMSICSASTVSLESFFSKMFIILGLTADNQKNIHRGIIKHKNVSSIGDWNSTSVEILTQKFQAAIRNWQTSDVSFDYSFNSNNIVNIIKTL